MKKSLSIFLNFSAFAILLGHNLIAHHHQETELLSTKHHKTCHHQESQHEDKRIHDLFCHFIHSAEGFVFVKSHKLDNTFSGHSFSDSVVSSNHILLNEFLKLPLLHRSLAVSFIYISPHSLYLGLRAPPAFIA